jgi:uncharacterized protein YecT (DUF1311 family)
MPTRPRRPAVRPNTRLAIGALVLTAGLFVLGSPPAQATDCSSQDLKMRELTECADQRLKRADADLNTVYAAVQKKIEAADRKRLRDAERAWITFRDAECLYRIGGEDYGDQGGTLWPMLELQCRADLTEARVKDLREELKCPSFDLSCPAK